MFAKGQSGQASQKGTILDNVAIILVIQLIQFQVKPLLE